MMRRLLIVTTGIEVAMGIVLTAFPAWIVSVLLGEPLSTSAGLLVARLAGAALLSLGTACWLAGRDTESRAASGTVAAMLVYNVAVVVLFLLSPFRTAGLLSALVLHIVMGVWCIACLRTFWLEHSTREAVIGNSVNRDP